MQTAPPGAPRSYKPYEIERMLALEGVELASFRERACAFAIDMAMASALAIALLQLLVEPVLDALGVDKHLELELSFETWYGLLYFVLFFGLSLYLGNGRTLGKRLLGIRVVSLVHHRLSLWHCVERALGYGASTAECTFGFFQYFIHPNRRTVHDRMAETIVVRDKPRDPAGAMDRRRMRLWLYVVLVCLIAAALSAYYFRAPMAEFFRGHVHVHLGLSSK